MKALLSTRPGGPDTLVLRDVERPTPKAGEVLVDVRACGVNFPDTLVIEDRYQLRPPRPFSPGSELAGVVAAVGVGVTGLRPGQRVLASLPFGAMAEFVRVPAVRCVALPDAMPFDEAASFQVTYGTCYYALRTRGGLAPGETLLVLGASGGIGLAAVELGKALGARVVAAASSEAKCKLARAAGADAVPAYPPGPLSREDAKAFSAALRQAAGEDGVDLVIDPVGGDYAEPALRAMTWGGRYLVIGFTAGIPVMPLNLALLKSTSIIGVFWGAHMARAPETGAREMADLLALYAAGQVRPRISARFPLAQAGEAIALLGQRQSTGKLVVQVRPDSASCAMPAADPHFPP